MAQAPSYQSAIVKQVLAGDSIIVRDQPRGGPPPERQLNLSGITAPRLGRRSGDGKQDQKDQPYAWESREFLRKKLVGRKVSFYVDYKVPSTGREYAVVLLGHENIADLIVAEGLATVRKAGGKASEEQTRLSAIEEIARASKKGVHNDEEESKNIRDVKWNISNANRFLEQNKGKEFNAIIEHVRDGSTVRAFLEADHQYITILMSGIKAKFFTESRILQRDVKVTLEGISNQNFIGTINHPNGNIAEFLLREGLARCIDWSMAVMSTGKEKLRAAEKQAKGKHARIWKSYKPSVSSVNANEKEFSAKVMEIVNADTIVVKLADNTTKKITFSSLRPPSNVAEALIGKGYATVLRHRSDDEQRSLRYDDLFSAEMRAQKGSKGLHSKNESSALRIADVSGDLAKAKQFLPFLQRAGRSSGVVEFIASGSRLRVFIPKETCLITVLLAGISCPKTKSQRSQAEPYGEAALEYTKSLCMQRDVKIEVDGTDRAGNFIGWIFVDSLNISVELVKNGLAKIHFSAEKSNYYNEMQTAEEAAKKAKIKVWENFAEPEEKEEEEEIIPETPKETKSRRKNIIVTEILGIDHFYAQHIDAGPKLEALTNQLRSDLKSNPPIPGSYSPQPRALCAAMYEDDEWYRAQIEKVTSSSAIEVLYIDYGNRATVSTSRLAPLPSAFHSVPPQAHEYHLALVQEPSDVNKDCSTISNDNEQQLGLEVEFKLQNQEHVSLYTADQLNVAKELISKGYLQVQNRREKRLAKLVTEFKESENIARMDRLNIWRYGDITPDDAREFGYSK
ncbi:uncharacterized protein TRIADDRAFT_49990 [Trichoplax adhaerens]|uniref:Staphylococcal nuclease domain-containing protein 1 n=1 Tax=Trichoplax adhaerens TaxID=10228 RepID=B3RRQ5_TRIAD|nr:hypothetical protein TRIADDRAFT_49990 [Trichoplax adhaerens]EDV26392.1 hypothetical protein TRIADDRAFT_49990 [Trichoplax adhaerens]|eukprot:XP_002110388.1 hypothetical protein TRIADDRAFT_49990 [Trichoplax adhaerens]